MKRGRVHDSDTEEDAEEDKSKAAAAGAVVAELYRNMIPRPLMSARLQSQPWAQTQTHRPVSRAALTHAVDKMWACDPACFGIAVEQYALTFLSAFRAEEAEESVQVCRLQQVLQVRELLLGAMKAHVDGQWGLEYDCRDLDAEATQYRKAAYGKLEGDIRAEVLSSALAHLQRHPDFIAAEKKAKAIEVTAKTVAVDPMALQRAADQQRVAELRTRAAQLLAEADALSRTL